MAHSRSRPLPADVTQRWPLLLAAALACAAGAFRVAEASDATEGWMLLGAGLVTLGAWIALEVQRNRHDPD